MAEGYMSQDFKAYPKILPIMALIVTAFIGSIMGIFARELSHALNVVEQVALRSFMGTIVLLCLCWRAIDFVKFRRIPKQDLTLTITRSVAMFVIAISLGTVAFVQGNYASAAVIMALPTLALLSRFMFGEAISGRETFFVMLAFLGAALTILAGSGLSLSLDWPLLCALFATVFMSFGILARKWQSPFLNNYETTFIMLLTATICTTVISFAWCLWTGRVPQLTLYLIGVGVVAGLANIGFLMLTNFAIPQLKGVVTNNLLALQPLFGTSVGFVFFGEGLTAASLVGGLLILLSVVAIENPKLLSKKKANTSATTI